MVKNKIKPKTNNDTKKSSNRLTSKKIKEEEELPPLPVQKKGRQTNNSLASADGQIVIDTCDSEGKSKKGSGKHGSNNISEYGCEYNFDIEEEERQIGMYKVINLLKDHEDAWPFIDPVDEQYAPRYYSVVRRPMDLSTMEEKLEEGSYKSVSQFKHDFHLIVDNCKQYNGSDNEYTEMVINLKEVFDRAVDRYLESEQSSDDSVSISSSTGINSSSYKKKILQSAVRYSQRHKHSRKLTKKSKSVSKVNKKKSRFQIFDDSTKDKKDTKIQLEQIKEKKYKKKSKNVKSEIKLKENTDEQENKSVIGDIKIIKSKKKQLSDLDKIESKKHKVPIMGEIKEEFIKPNKKTKKEMKSDKKKESRSAAAEELKENRKRKEDIKEDSDTIIPKVKSRKIEKKEDLKFDNSVISDTSIDRLCKNEVKDNKSAYKLQIEEDKLSTSEKNIKVRKTSKDKSSSVKHGGESKKKQSKKKHGKSVENGELKTEVTLKNIECLSNIRNSDEKRFESLATDKDIESLDSLKDKISKKHQKEKLKVKKDKKKKQYLKSDSFHTISNKVPFNGSIYRHGSDTLSNKTLKSKVKKEKADHESISSSQADNEPKKIKTHNRHSKGSGKDPSIRALNQATEQTLNEINKWLDDTPRLSEFSAGSVSPILSVTTNDALPIPINKNSSSTSSLMMTLTTSISTAATSTITVSITASTTTMAATVSSFSGTGIGSEACLRKRQNMKLLGSQVSCKPKKVQRTIDRLQPGKSKGNLLSKKLAASASTSSDSGAVSGDISINQALVDNDQLSWETSNEPKLSLGSVLKNVDSIHLICKSLASSPNLKDDENQNSEHFLSKPTASPGSSTAENILLTTEKNLASTELKSENNKKETDSKTEMQKPKSATPNLSAWFKAFGAPKPKKKEDDDNIIPQIKKDDMPESSGTCMISGRQRRISTGGSSVSESISSYSQESPPSRTGRSPQQSQQPPNIIPSSLSLEPQNRGAGFYQDAMSTSTSPYNSPFYSTPPRYSAQLPPTPSPQHHALSPAYSATYDQVAIQAPLPSLYSQISLQKLSPQAQSPTKFSQQSPQNCFPQSSPRSESQQPYTPPTVAAAQKQSPVYPQQSPQPLQTSPYPQTSPLPANYSQPSPQSQPPTPGYSQSSPQTPATNYSQPSPSQVASLNFSQSSPQQQHSPYSQTSPQPPSGYSQPSPQSQHSTYSQASPQQTNLSQISPRPPSSTYSQPSPQPPGYTTETPSPYSQPDLVIVQPSPQASRYSHSPQQASGYSPASPQTPPPYPTQLSPQQQSSSYAQESSQTSTSLPQLSPQQSRIYSSQPSPQQQTVQGSQTQQQISNYLQSLSDKPCQQQQQQQQQQPISNVISTCDKTTENHSENSSASPTEQAIKSSYLQSTSLLTSIAKPATTKDKQTAQSQNQQLHSQLQQSTEHLVALNQAIYNSTSSSQYPLTYPSNMFSASNRVSNQLTIETSSKPSTSRLINQDSYQQLTQQKQTHQSQEQQSQLLNFAQNLTSHESLYSSSFQTTPYSMSNAVCRPVYPGYFDGNTKGTANAPNQSVNSITSIRKRTYNDPTTSTDLSGIQTSQRTGQDQYGFDALMALTHPQPDVSLSNQFDGSFNSSLVDSVTSNPTYARLQQLGLVSSNAKESQQILSIPRSQNSKSDSLTAYARTSSSNQSELELNLLHSLQGATVKGANMLSIQRRATVDKSSPSATSQLPVTTKSKRSKKNKQQQPLSHQQHLQQQQPQLNVPLEQQSSGISGFSQYGTSTTDSIGLKQPTMSGSAFNFGPASGTANNAPFYDKEASAAAYAFLDDFRNPNLPSYYTMALRQQQQQVASQPQVTVQQPSQQSIQPASETATQQTKLTNQTTARNYPSHPFLHPAQRPNPYAPPVPPYVAPHGTNLGVDPAAYQQYLHSLYALQPPPHHRPSWI